MDMKIAPTDIFPWNENFETGVVVVDEQHRILVDLLNKLASHMAHGVDKRALNKVFDELVDYAKYHFATEEGIWGTYLPKDELFIDHVKTHHDFESEVLALKRKQNKNQEIPRK